MKKFIFASLILVLCFGTSVVFANDEIIDTDEDITIDMTDPEFDTQQDIVDGSGDLDAAPNLQGIVFKKAHSNNNSNETQVVLGHFNEYEYWVPAGQEEYYGPCKGATLCQIRFENNTWILVARSATRNANSGCGNQWITCHAMGKVKKPVAAGQHETVVE